MFFSVIDAPVIQIILQVSEIGFRKNIKTNDDNQKIRRKEMKKKLQYDINRQAAKISALSTGKIDNYGYLTC